MKGRSVRQGRLLIHNLDASSLRCMLLVTRAFSSSTHTHIPPLASRSPYSVLIIRTSADTVIGVSSKAYLGGMGLSDEKFWPQDNTTTI